LQHGLVLLEVAVAVLEFPVLLGVVAGAQFAGPAGGRQPDEVEAALAEGAGVLADDLVPLLGAVLWELGLTVAVAPHVQAVEPDAVVVEPRLGEGRPRPGE